MIQKAANAPTDNAKARFKDRVHVWAAKLDINHHQIVVRAMRNKWASCSTSGRLTFDSTVLALDADLQDYVIVHELLHFHVPNHGKLWKSLMTAYLGDFQAQESRLEKLALSEPPRFSGGSWV